MDVLTVNLLCSILIFGIAARIYVTPRLKSQSPRTLLLPILLLHGLRHLGLMFLSPGATYAGMPQQFARPAAFGGLLAAVLAIVAIPAVLTGSGAARILVLVFNVEGTLDLINAIVLANHYQVTNFTGPAYWIPAFWVPVLLVTHYITFLILRRHWNSPSWR